MTREEQVAFCRKCTNRKFDQQQGIICRLTDKKADFEDSCPDFNLDEHVKEKGAFEPQTERASHELIADLSNDLKDRFREYQDFSSALIGGLLLTLVGAALWAAITVITEYQIGYMAIGIGLMIGFGVRYFGAGVDRKFGILGAVLALLSCLLGNFFAQIGFLAKAEGITFLQSLQIFDYSYLSEVITSTFSPMDLLFYGFAVYEGYKFAFRAITQEDLELVKNPDYEPIPPGYKFRRVSAIAASVILLATAFILNQPAEGTMSLTYEDGTSMSEGAFVGGKEDGPWKYWYPNGKLQGEVNFSEGIAHGKWTLYYESGKKMSEGEFLKGTKHGLWTTYHTEGQVANVGEYLYDREAGEWKIYHENGQLQSIGSYEAGYPYGEWKVFHDNGQLESEGQMNNGEQTGIWKTYQANGNPLSEIRYAEGQETVINSWNLSGVQTVTDGSGTFEEYYETGELMSKGQIRNGKRTGNSTSYYPDGTKSQEGEYIDGKYRFISTWETNGDPQVVNGNGRFESYLDMGLIMIEDGNVVNGKRDGTWYDYYPTSGNIFIRTDYKSGEIEGKRSTFHETGQTWFEGMMSKGKETGEWKWYFDTGELESTAFFENGVKTGTQTFWDLDGRKIKEETYENGKLTNTRLLID